MDRFRLALLAITLSAAAATLGASSVGCTRCRPAPPPEEPAALWPLTGEEAPSEDAIRERIVSVKIENAAAARPQTGLSEADVVYETLTEGGITRFNAIFHSRSPERVGPVRSARLSDLYIVPQYGAIFAYSGANRTVLDRIAASGIEDAGTPTTAEPYQRSAERSAPHNLYTGIGGLRAAAEAKGFPTEADPPELRFGEAPETEAASGTVVTVPFRAQNRVTWRWDEAAERYLREINGEPHVDTEEDTPYSAANVVVVFAATMEGDRPGTTEIRLTGSGEALVLRGGRRFEGGWSAEEGSPPRFSTTAGEELRLATGPTWIEVVPNGFPIETE
ncbi:MAG: DUF3048 domain-containing protein [Coriobacteriia bacterium]|nr:DUF3048 domain-containing protein [Coriobacteriia bacterium]